MSPTLMGKIIRETVPPNHIHQPVPAKVLCVVGPPDYWIAHESHHNLTTIEATRKGRIWPHAVVWRVCTESLIVSRLGLQFN
jgi:hypothetical protein